MYVETKGYILMNEKELNFVDNEGFLCEDLNSEDILFFEDKSDAKEAANDYSKEFNTDITVVNYSKTIWIDKDEIDETKKVTIKDNQDEEEKQVVTIKIESEEEE